MGKREDPIHRSILRYLQMQYPGALIHYSPNELNHNSRWAMKNRRKSKEMGMLAGFPDIIMLLDGAFFAFEVKAKGNYPTVTQKDVGALIEVNGGCWAVVRSIEDVQDAIADFQDLDGWPEVELRGTIR